MVFEIETKACMVCSKKDTLEVSEQEYTNLFDRGMHVQDAMPDRDAGFREQVITGTHDACFERMFG